MTQSVVADPVSPAAKANPYPTYAYLRENQPVHCVTLPSGGHRWLITRYADAERALCDPRLVKTRPADDDLPDDVRPLMKSLIGTDPPDHTRLRALVRKAFSPRLVDRLRPRIQQIADELLDAVAHAGWMDLIDDYAFPLPIMIITELLGVPSADSAQFRVWSNAFLADELPSAGEPLAAWRRTALTEFSTYLRALFERKRADPQDDLVTRLVLAREQGDALTAEELLRYTGPAETASLRYASTDIDYQGVTIPQGDQVVVVLASANRDETRFARADQLDITRTGNHHLGFGKGIHFCLGAPLARIEGQIGIGTLLRRMPDLRPAVPLKELQWRPSMIMRGLKSFPVRFTAPQLSESAAAQSMTKGRHR